MKHWIVYGRLKDCKKQQIITHITLLEGDSANHCTHCKMNHYRQNKFTNRFNDFWLFWGGGGWPQRHHASCIVRYICWLHNPTSTQSIKLQCTLVTKTIVNHLKPKNKEENCPHHSEYDTLDISLLIINISTITHFFFSEAYGKHWKSRQLNQNKILIFIMAKMSV